MEDAPCGVVELLHVPCLDKKSLQCSNKHCVYKLQIISAPPKEEFSCVDHGNACGE
jgi:hypothetical protein